MEQLLGFALPGVPYGCTYALVAVCLVLTYQATGVFNFAFGAQAFASAFIFTYLTQYHNWSGWEAFILTVVVLGPVMGYAFDRLIFRHIPNSNSTAKLVCGLALLVGIPSLLPVIFGPQNLDATATIFPFFNPNTVYFTIGSGLYGTPINGIYLSTISVTVVVLVLLTILLRFTSLGLQMRGAVESRRLVQLDGINANGVVAVAWIISSFMAALAGVLLAPVYGAFNSDEFVTLTVTAIAAAAWAMLRSLPIAAGVAVLIGVVTTVLQGYIPPDSFWNAAVVPSLPFFAIAAALLILPGLRNLDSSRDPLATIDPPPQPIAASTRAPTMDRIIRTLWYVLLAGFIVSMLTWIPATWETVFNNGLTLAIICLSVTLITGMAGQLSLCQATFAGIGAFTAAVFSVHLGFNFLVGGLIGAAIAVHRGRRPGAVVPALAGTGVGADDVGGGVALRQHGLQRHLGDRRRPGHQPAVEVAGDECLLQLRRPRHVHPLHGRARPWPWSSCSWSARGPSAATWPPCGGARRRRPVSVSTRPGSASSSSRCPGRSPASAACSTAFSSSTCPRWTGTRPSRSSWSSWW